MQSLKKKSNSVTLLKGSSPTYIAVKKALGAQLYVLNTIIYIF